MVDLDSAEEYYRASYVIREDFDDPEGMAVALTHLGAIALARNDNEQAETLYRQSATLYKGIGDRGGLVWAWHGSGMAALAQNQIKRARQHLQQALEVAVETEITPLLLSVLVGVGTFLVQCGEAHWGLATWAFVRDHPATDQRSRDKVRRLLASRHPGDIQDPANTLPQTEPLTLASLISALIRELSIPRNQIRSPSHSAPPPVPQQEQVLIEPLSEREQEVLALVAQGLKNTEIAQELYVTLSTVKAHCNNIYRKLDVNNRVQAVARAQELRLL